MLKKRLNILSRSAFEASFAISGSKYKHNCAARVVPQSQSNPAALREWIVASLHLEIIDFGTKRVSNHIKRI